MIEARSASFTIDDAQILTDITLQIRQGETVAIAGPNGAGKSTLLRLLSGESRPTTGAILLSGMELSAFSPRALARRRAMLSQHVHVTFPFEVEDIVAMGAGDDTSSFARDTIARVMSETGLEALRRRQLPTLSGGEQQRAHFARVLVQLSCAEARHGPGVLLLDEPTSSLDLRHQIDLIDVARRCAQNGTAVIAILHDLNLSLRFAERMVLIRDGGLAADGPTQEVVTAARVKEIFQVDARILDAEDGRFFVVPC